MTHSYICDTTRLYLWHDSFTYLWHDSFIFVTWLLHIFVTWLIYICDVTSSYICDMTHLYLWHDLFIYLWHDSFIFVTRLLYVCDMTPLCVWHHSCTTIMGRRNCSRISFLRACVCVCVTGLIHSSAMTPLLFLPWLLCVCNKTPLFVWYDSSVCDMTHVRWLWAAGTARWSHF